MKRPISIVGAVALLVTSITCPLYGAGLILDEFDKAGLHLSWSWHRENADMWSLQERAGYLRIHTEPGSLYGGGTARNVLLRRIPPNELNVTAHMDFEPTQDYQEAGIMLYEDDDHYVKLSRIHYSDVGGSCLLLAYEKDGVDQPGALMTGYQGSKEVELALIRRSEGIVGAYRERGATTWIKFGRLGIGGHVHLPHMGVFAHSGGNAASIPADLDSVRISIDGPLERHAKSDTADQEAPVLGTTSSSGRGLILSPAWMGPQSGGAKVIRDLHRLLAAHGEATIDLAAHNDLRIYRDVTYLMPVQEAAKKLGVRTRVKRMLDTPGFPKSSFYVYEIDGRFEQRFNTLQFVTDAADQVVAIQFANSKPRTGWLYDHDEEWSVYNVVQGKRKGSRRWKIAHHYHKEEQVLRIDTELKDRDEKSREWAQFYVPEPIINLLLYRARKLLD